MQLENAFKSPDARVKRVFLFVDMADSTGMKTRQAEVAWIPILGAFYDVVSEQMKSEENARIVKYLGDGMMIAFEDRKRGATQAVNAAIRMQESLRRLRRAKRLLAACSIGIAGGDAIKFDVNNQEDYVGAVVDRAARLCSKAAPDAIFIDQNTADWAAWPEVESPKGKVDEREPGDYRGDVGTIELEGFLAPVKYYEVLWSDNLYSVKKVEISKGVNQRDEEKRARSEALLKTSIEYFNINDLQNAFNHLVESAALGNENAAGLAVEFAKNRVQRGDIQNAKVLLRWAQERGNSEASDLLGGEDAN